MENKYIKAELCPAADFDIKFEDVPPSPKPGIIGGMNMTLNVGTHPMWQQRVRLLLNQRPKYIPVFVWRWMLRQMVVQWQQHVDFIQTRSV